MLVGRRGASRSDPIGITSYAPVALESMAASRPASTSANFAFLVGHDRLLDHLGALAEQYFAEDPAPA